MSPERQQQLQQLMQDTMSLITRLHDELGTWDYVEGFLVGAVVNHPNNRDGFDELESMTLGELEAEILAGEMAWKGGFNG